MEQPTSSFPHARTRGSSLSPDIARSAVSPLESGRVRTEQQRRRCHPLLCKSVRLFSSSFCCLLLARSCRPLAPHHPPPPPFPSLHLASLGTDTPRRLALVRVWWHDGSYLCFVSQILWWFLAASFSALSCVFPFVGCVRAPVRPPPCLTVTFCFALAHPSCVSVAHVLVCVPVRACVCVCLVGNYFSPPTLLSRSLIFVLPFFSWEEGLCVSTLLHRCAYADSEAAVLLH